MNTSQTKMSAFFLWNSLTTESNSQKTTQLYRKSRPQPWQPNPNTTPHRVVRSSPKTRRGPSNKQEKHYEEPPAHHPLRRKRRPTFIMGILCTWQKLLGLPSFSTRKQTVGMGWSRASSRWLHSPLATLDTPPLHHHNAHVPTHIRHLTLTVSDATASTSTNTSSIEQKWMELQSGRSRQKQNRFFWNLTIEQYCHRTWNQKNSTDDSQEYITR